MDDPRRVIQIAKDFQKCMKHLPNFTDNQVRLEDWDQDALTYIDIVIEPNDGLYKGGTYKFKIVFSGTTYPDESPLIKSLSPIHHPNIDYDHNFYKSHPDSTAVCLSLFNDDWNSSCGLENVIQGLLFLFYHPNLDDPYTPAFTKGVPEDSTVEEIFRDELETVFKGERPSRVDDESIVFQPIEELKSTGEEVQKSRILLGRSDTLVNELTSKALKVEKEIQNRRFRIASLKKATTVAHYPCANSINVLCLGLKLSVVSEWFNDNFLQAEHRNALANEFVQFQTQIENKLQSWPSYKRQSYICDSGNLVTDIATTDLPSNEGNTENTERLSETEIEQSKNEQVSVTAIEHPTGKQLSNTCYSNNIQHPQNQSIDVNLSSNPHNCGPNCKESKEQHSLNPMASSKTTYQFQQDGGTTISGCFEINTLGEEVMDTSTAEEGDTTDSMSGIPPGTTNATDNSSTYANPVDTQQYIETSSNAYPGTPPLAMNSSCEYSYSDVKPIMRKCTTFDVSSQVNICSKQALQEWRMKLQ